MLVDNGVSRLDLSISLGERDGRLISVAEYNTDLFDAVDSDLTLEGLAILAERALTDAT